MHNPQWTFAKFNSEMDRIFSGTYRIGQGELETIEAFAVPQLDETTEDLALGMDGVLLEQAAKMMILAPNTCIIKGVSEAVIQ